MTPRQRENILRGLDKMVKKGQMTTDEADRLREATDPEEFEIAVRSVRARHASMRLDGAVRNGSMTKEEADNVIARIQKGEHSRSLRSHLQHLVPRNPGRFTLTSSGKDATRTWLHGTR